MKCTICYEAVAPAAFNCPWCGSELPRYCGSCGKAVPAGERVCPACGFDPPVAPPPPGSTRIPGCPWEDRSRPLLARWWSGWVMSQFKPDLWFRTVPVQGGHGSPLLYFVLTQAIYAAAYVILALLMTLLISAFGMPAEGFAFMMAFIFGYAGAWIAVTIALLYVLSAVYHVVAMLFGSKAPFERTVRVLAFASGPVVWTALPYVGVLISPAWMAVLAVFGFRKLHGLTAGRAVCVALLPPFLAALLCGLWIAWMVSSLM